MKKIILLLVLVLSLITMFPSVNAEKYITSDYSLSYSGYTYGSGWYLTTTPSSVGFSTSNITLLYYISDYWYSNFSYAKIGLFYNYSLKGYANNTITSSPNIIKFDITLIPNYYTANQFNITIYSISSPTQSYSTVRTELLNNGFLVNYGDEITQRLNIFDVDVDVIYDSGFNDGFEDGFFNGYEDGFIDGENTLIEMDLWQALISALTIPFEIFSIEIFPGIYIGYFLLVPLVFGGIYFILSLKKGR